MPCLARLSPVLLLLTVACAGDKEVVQEDPVWSLRLQLADDVAVAGDEVSYTVIAESDQGDVRDVIDWTISSEQEPDLRWDSDFLQPTRAGSHTIEAWAELDGVAYEASEQLGVNAGPSTMINLSLDARNGSIEVGDPVEATVTTADDYGNPTNEDWDLTIDGGAATIDGSTITFDEDGYFTVNAVVAAAGLIDSDGPIMVDSSGPVFTMAFPERVDLTDSKFQAVSGTVTDDTSGLLYATLNGESIDVDGDGAFDIPTGWEFGLNVITLEAVDNDGNDTEHVHTLLRGETLSLDETVSEGLVVRLADGEGGLDSVVQGVETEVAAIDISSSLPITFAGSKYDLAITDVTWTIGEVDIYPIEDQMVASVTLEDIEVTIEGEVKAAIWIDAGGSVTIDALTVEVFLEPYITSGGGLSMRVDSTDVVVDNLELDFSNTVFSVLDSIGVDTIVEEEVTDLLEEQIAVQVQTQIRTQVEAALESLVMEQSTTVLEKVFTISGSFARMDIDEGGVTVGLDVAITPEEATPETWMDGSLVMPYEAPDMSGISGIATGINLDLLNRVLHLAWAQGALVQTLTSEEMGLNAEALALVFPNATSVTFTTEAMMPPVVLPGDMTTPLYAQLGSLRLMAVDQDGAMLLDMYVSLEVDIDVDVADQVLTPSIALAGDPWIEVATVAEQSTGIVNYEALVELMLPQVMDSIAPALSAITLPTVGTATLEIDRVIPYGTDGGYLTATGALYLE